MVDDLRILDGKQRSAVLASYLGWTLDAFDFFILVFVVKDVATTSGTDVKSVAYALFLTLAARPVGALIFGLAADKFGRRPTLMVDIVLFSILEFATGFAPNLWVFLVLRALFGVAMGGAWGVGACSQWRRSRPSRAASSWASCRPAIRAVISSPRSCSASFSR